MKKQIGSAALLALALLASPAASVETQLWVSDSPGDYAKAEARGVVVQPDGVLRLGPSATTSSADSLPVIWALAVLADGSVAVAGDGGRVERWTESSGVRSWVKLPVGQVLSLLADGDGVLAGTGPQGLIYRIGPRGDTALVARTNERYVWGLAPAGKGAWYAATGTRGRLHKIEGGQARVVLDTDESNLVSLVADGQGGAFAGGDSKGRVVHVRADGTATTVYDAAEDEVRALALGPDGTLYAAALTASATATTRGGEGDEDDERDRGPQPVRSAVTGGRATVYRIVPERSAATLWTSLQPLVFALAVAPSGLVASTGNRAAVYLLGATAVATQWLAVPEGQITALGVDRKGRVLAASSNPGAVWALGPEPATRGELLSSVLDARRYARFGRIAWRGTSGGGRVELFTRSGNTDPPDTTWSPWKPAGGGDRARVEAPAARYLQWKLALQGGDPRVDAVEVVWREQNLPPRVDDVVVAPQGIGFREGELQPRPEPVTQTLPGGQRVEYSAPGSSSPRALRDLPAWARGIRTVQWKASDPNGDPLRYTIEARTEEGGPWIRLEEDLGSTAFTWDTQGLPDGRYRLRIVASDAASNAVGEGLVAEALSRPFTVDNTPPAILAFDLRGERGAIVVSGRAEDGQSILSRLEVSVGDQEWRAISPEGGLADERVLRFQVRLPDIEPGEHVVAVRAVDLAGNGTTRAGRVTVPRDR